MNNKRKKGFTLIELLAIIVILAIIAVITVPIILNIIDNAKKGSATDSAYGYKNAIDRYYFYKSLEDTNYQIEDGEYTVDAGTGYLVGMETLDIELSGQKPTMGSVIIKKNEVEQACLQFGDYAVTINDNELSTEKSECPAVTPKIPTCPNCVFVDLTMYPDEEGKYIGVDSITTYETDYTKITKRVFLGYILNEDTKIIERAYVCGINGTTPFCIEGTKDNARIENGISNLNKIISNHIESANDISWYIDEINYVDMYLSNDTIGSLEIFSFESNGGVCSVFTNDGRTGCYSS